jgi:hypothetical protein
VVKAWVVAALCLAVVVFSVGVVVFSLDMVLLGFVVRGMVVNGSFISVVVLNFALVVLCSVGAVLLE